MGSRRVSSMPRQSGEREIPRWSEESFSLSRLVVG